MPPSGEVRTVLEFTQDDIGRLAARGRIDRVARRDVVALDRPMVTLVLDGYFRVFRNAAFVRDVTLFLAARGDMLGPSVAFGERAAETGAEALSNGHVLFATRESFEDQAAETPDLYLKLARSLGRRLARVQKKLEEISRAGVEARVAGSLLDLADDFGSPTSDGVRLDLPLSQEDLARLAGTTRESCSTAVAAFAREGLVRGGRLKGMVLVDALALRAYAEQTVALA